jgi:hypothetical protein
MAAELLSFFRPAKSVSGDWSTQEIAEFYRVEAALVQSGASVFIDRGVSDEGDPWFVFCRAIDGDVIVHFARIDGRYLIVAESVGLPLCGSDFRGLLADFVNLNPTLIPMPNSRGAKLMLHPASLLAAVVATALYHMSGTEAIASALDSTTLSDSPNRSHHAEHLTVLADGSHDLDRQWIDRQVAAVVAAMAVLAAIEFSPPTKETLTDLASTILEFAKDQLIPPQPTDVAQILPTPDLVDQSYFGRHIGPQHVHTWLDDLFLPVAGEAMLQQFQVSANDNALTKLPSSIIETPSQDLSTMANWWDPPSHNADINSRYFAWTDPLTGLAGGNAYNAPFTGGTPVAPAVVVQAQNQEAQGSSNIGSSSPDQPAFQLAEFQAASFVNSEMNVADRAVPQINVGGNLSFQGIIISGALDVFGPALPTGLQAVIQHGPTTIQDAFASSTQLDQIATVTPAVQLQPASVPITTQTGSTYQAFNATAGTIVNAFLQQNDVEEVVSNNTVVLFDTNVSHFSSPDFVFKTWAMSDGSTITIIGQLPHSLALLA